MSNHEHCKKQERMAEYIEVRRSQRLKELLQAHKAEATFLGGYVPVDLKDDKIDAFGKIMKALDDAKE